ncbi:MAG: hypothetical protein P8Z81_00810 [Deinococcales bacterium]
MDVTTWTDLLTELAPKLARLRVRAYGSGGAPYHHLALAALFGADVGAVSAEQIRAGGLDGADVLVVPGGGARAMAGLLAPLGADGAAAVRAWVERGGMYVGSCAGAFLPAAVGESFWDENPQARQLCMLNAQLFNRADSEWAGLTSPGVGTVHVVTERPRHWLARGLPPVFRLVHYNGPMFDAAAGAPPAPARVGGATLSEMTGVVRFSRATADFTPGEAFLGPPPDGPTLFESGAAAGAFSAVEGAYGDGAVVLYGSHPEFGLDTVQVGWDDGVRLFANALVRQASRRPDAAAVGAECADGGEGAALEPGAVARALRAAQAMAADHAGRFEDLAWQDPGGWAAPGSVARFMGLEPPALWRQAALDAAAASRATAAYLATLTPPAEPVPGIDVWLTARAPEEQDYGFVGLVPLLERVGAMLAAARAAMATSPFALTGPYDALDRHPYQLGLSSYLSAAGLAAAGLMAAVAIGRRLGDRAPLPSTRLLATLH